MLEAAGIRTAADLRRLGAVAAFARVRAHARPAHGRRGTGPSLNLLWALEGALTGLPWQQVAREHRLSLTLALEEHEALQAHQAHQAYQARQARQAHQAPGAPAARAARASGGQRTPACTGGSRGGERPTRPR
ncbi:MAG: TfoX/Sxy family DNA transformation protein [Rubrivivax sp.]|nr:TfoX/Sxy family DNA transformation protein [Rubrivivax sp.]